jgi:4-amino-4-deoxy-L-arabinose transferase-like glycosyltransferase
LKRLYIPIVAVLLLAAALRILGAGGSPVWTDEGWSAWASSDPAQVIGIVAADRHPPLYFAALSAWRQVAGDSRIALRLLSIAAGVITVAAVYRIGADWFGRRAGLLAALLLAALPSAVYYAQEVRHYGWLSLFTALSWLVLLRYLRKPGRALWVGYVLCITAMLYTLYFGVFTLAAQAVTVLLAAIGDWRKVGRHTGLPLRFAQQWGALAAAWAAAGVLYLPWVYVIATEQAGILGGGISGAPNTISPGNLLLILQSVLSAQVLIPLVGFALGVWAIARRPNIGRVGVLLGGAGLLVGMILLSLRFDLLGARTLVFLTPLLALVCGYGLSRLDVRLGAALLGVWLALTLVFPTEIQARLHSEAAAEALASAYQPGDVVILEAGWDDNAFAYEIAQALPDGAEIVRTQPWTNERTGGAPVVPQIEPILQAHERVWVVQWLQAPQVLPFLEAGGDGFHLTQTLDVSAGAYGERFFAPTIQVRLYTR